VKARNVFIETREDAFMTAPPDTPTYPTYEAAQAAADRQRRDRGIATAVVIRTDGAYSLLCDTTRETP